MRGFTTVCDLAGPMFGIKAAIDVGVIPGPRLYPREAFVSRKSGHGDLSLPYGCLQALGGPGHHTWKTSAHSRLPTASPKCWPPQASVANRCLQSWEVSNVFVQGTCA